MADNDNQVQDIKKDIQKKATELRLILNEASSRPTYYGKPHKYAVFIPGDDDRRPDLSEEAAKKIEEKLNSLLEAVITLSTDNPGNAEDFIKKIKEFVEECSITPLWSRNAEFGGGFVGIVCYIAGSALLAATATTLVAFCLSGSLITAFTAGGVVLGIIGMMTLLITTMAAVGMAPTLCAIGCEKMEKTVTEYWNNDTAKVNVMFFNDTVTSIKDKAEQLNNLVATTPNI